MIRLSDCGKFLMIMSVASENSKASLLEKNENWKEFLEVQDKENEKGEC